ncbi:MAG TPA: hypothetical protein VG890_00390 [Puia sp.]|nr:hypothetical protein [Puia sp.]
MFLHPEPPADPLEEAEFDRRFKPKGALVFFILFTLVGLIIWFGIYFLMLGRI